MRKNLYEIFDEITKAPDTAARMALLRQNETPALVEFLKGVYNPDVKFAVTSIPKYRPSDAPPGLGLTSMDMELKRAYLFQVEHPKKPRELSAKRQEQILIQVLESLEAREAELFGNMLLKKLDVPTMSRGLAEVAFPGRI